MPRGIRKAKEAPAPVLVEAPAKPERRKRSASTHMSGADFVKAFADKSGLSVSDSRKMIQCFFGTLEDGVKAHGGVQFVGLGTFLRKVTPAGERFSPFHKKVVPTAERHKMVFKGSKSFNEALGS